VTLLVVRGDSLPFVLIAAKDNLGMSNVSTIVDCGVGMMFVTPSCGSA
jgi:hypothetical protein